MDETNQTPNPVTQNLSDDQVIDLFIEGLMTEKGVDAPTDEIRATVHADLKNQLLTELDRALVSALPEDKLAELSQTAENNEGALDPNLVADAIASANLDTVEIIGTTMKRFGETYLGHTLQDDSTPTDPTTTPAAGTDQPQPSTEEQGA